MPTTYIDLGLAQPVTLGRLVLNPPLRTIRRDDGAEEIVEPRVMQVLLALIDARGGIVRREELTERCWKGRIVGEDAINRTISRLRHVAAKVGEDSFRVETVTRIGYRLIEVDAEGTPTAAATATPAAALPGEIPTSTRPAVSRSISRRAWAIGGLAVACLIAIMLVVLRPWATRADVALAPVATDGSAASTALANVLADRLDTLLSKAGYEARTLKSAGAGPAHATFLASAKVGNDGHNLDIALALSESDRPDVLWAGEFSRPKSDAQALAVEASSTSAAIIACALEWMSHSRHRLDPFVVKDLLGACDLNVGTQMRAEATKQRQDLARDIVAREPDFPPGLILLATSDLGIADEVPAEAPRLRAEARALAEHVLQVDPHFGGAYVVLSLLPPASASMAASYAELARAMHTSPDDAWINVYTASVLLKAGYLSEAVANEQRAVDLRPLDPWMLSMLVRALAQTGRIGDARAAVDRGLAQWPGHTELLMTQISIEARQGDPGRALRELDDAEGLRLSWYTPSYIASTRRVALARKAGTPEALTSAARTTEAAFQSGSLAEDDAMSDLMSLGAVDQAYALVQMHSEGVSAGVFFTPQAASFRADRRFMPLAEKLGMLEFWRSRGRWPDFCVAQNAPYDCAKAAAGL